MRHTSRFCVLSAFVLCLGLLTAACGSTATPRGQVVESLEGDDEYALESDTTDGTSAVDGSGSGGGAGSSQATTGLTTTRRSGTKTSGGSTGSGGSGTKSGTKGAVRGVTATEIKIGSWLIINPNSANEAQGAESDFPDPYVTEAAILEDMNANGGILGRTVKPVHYVQDGDDHSTPWSIFHQQACEKWTKDEPVFAALYGGYLTLDGCLADAGVPQICCSLPVHDKQQLARFPLMLAPSGMRVDRRVEALMQGLLDTGFFEPDSPLPVKVGLLAFDFPSYVRASTRIEQILAQHGLKLDDKHFVKEPESFNGTGPALSEGTAAITRFKSKGINRLISLDRGGIIYFYGTLLASSNGYTDVRWGIDSTGAAAVNSSNADTKEAQRYQIERTTVVGWMPNIDRGRIFERPNSDPSPGAQRCYALMQKKGLHLGDSGRHRALEACDTWWFLKAALEAGGSPTVEGLMTGAQKLGSSFPSPQTYQSTWGVNRRDGAAAYRILKWDPACDCFGYVSPRRQLP